MTGRLSEFDKTRTDYLFVFPALFKLTGVQTLRNCCGIYEVTRTKVADNVFVQVLDLQLDLLLEQTKRCFKCLKIWFNQTKFNEHASSAQSRFKVKANISPETKDIFSVGSRHETATINSDSTNIWTLLYFGAIFIC